MESEKSQELTIECSPKGPYLVKGLEKFVNSKGETIETKSVIALCRCGASSNKPFCDGTHAKIGFSGEKSADAGKDERDHYAGKKITIHDNRSICSHAGICTDDLASVFRLRTEPRIDPDGAEVEAIIETIRACPSGALSYSIDDVEHKDQERGAVITISKDGPYCVTGNIALKNVPRAEETSEEHYTLCRCGASKNKPFCDGSHWDAEFKDEEN